MKNFNIVFEKIHCDIDAMLNSSRIVMDSWNDKVSESIDKNVINDVQQISNSFFQEISTIDKSLRHEKDEIECSFKEITNLFEQINQMLNQFAVDRGDGIREFTDQQHHTKGFAVDRGDGIIEYTDQEHHTKGFAVDRGDGIIEYTDQEHHTKGFAVDRGDGITEYTDQQHHSKGFAVDRGDGRTEYTDQQHHSKGFAVDRGDEITEYTDQQHHSKGFAK